MAYMNTPQTDAGNATYMSNAYNLDDFSVENSILSPPKHKDDLVSQLRKGRGTSLKTPRSRVPFTDRRNLPTASRGEFTPLLQSAVKNNVLRKSKLGGGPQTPSIQQNRDPKGVAIPPVEHLALYEDDTGSSAERMGDGTPVPDFASSSIVSPLPDFPKRDAGRVLNGQGNVMTLREQENIVTKIEKENFGLKLKIHFLEVALREAGPGFNEAALKENTTLKIDRVTLQRELARARKTLSQAERELENYRHHLQDVQEEMKRKHLDEDLKQELALLKREVVSKQSEVEDLRLRLKTAEGRDELEDLEAELQMKEGLLEERDNEIRKLLAQTTEDAEAMADLRQELEYERDRIKALENDDKFARVTGELENLLRERENEVRGLQAQAEKDAKKMADLNQELAHGRDRVRALENDNKVAEVNVKLKALEADLQMKKDALDVRDSEIRELQAQTKKGVKQVADLYRELEHERERIKALENDDKVAEINGKLEDLEANVRGKEDLLDARENDIEELQAELEKHAKAKADLYRELECERDRMKALENDVMVAEANGKVHELCDEIHRLQRELDDKETEHALHQDHWESQRHALESQKHKLEEQAAGLQRTVDKLQESEGTMSNREMKLKEALESEKQRFRSEEAVLSRQIAELNADLADKRRILDELHSDLSNTRDQLRTSLGIQADLKEQVELFEEELEAGLDEEAERAHEEVEAVKREADKLRHELQVAKDDLLRVQTAHDDCGTRNGSDQQLLGQLHDLESRLARIQKDKQVLQDKLTAVDMELRSLRGASAETKDERDELKRQLSEMQNQVDENFRVDQGKLHELESRLARIQREKQVLQDKLATVNIELRSLRGESAETKVERDELKRQLSEMQNQVDETSRVDQGKLDLLKAKLRLENDVGRLREERKVLIEKRETAERELEEEIEKASSEAGILREEMTELRRKLAAEELRSNEVATQAKDKRHMAELKILKEEIAVLERKLAAEELKSKEAATQAKETKHMAELRILREEIVELQRRLATEESRSKEVTTQVKDKRHMAEVRSLREEIADLQRKLTAERLRSKEVTTQLKDKGHITELRISREERAEIPDQLKSMEVAMQLKDKRHTAELKGLSKQIMWLRARYTRERSFREGLAHGKQYLLAEIETHDAFTKKNLAILSRMGVKQRSSYPPRPLCPHATRLQKLQHRLDSIQDPAEKKPSLKAVALMIIAGARMQRMAKKWAAEKQIKSGLVKGLENVRRRRKGKGTVEEKLEEMAK